MFTTAQEGQNFLPRKKEKKFVISLKFISNDLFQNE